MTNMALTYHRLGARGERWTSARGTLEIRRPAADVIVRRFEGHASIEFVEPATGQLESVIAAGYKPVVFDDLELGTGYDSDVRVRLTAWMARHAKDFKEFHILTKPGLVSMGVTVANLTMGGWMIAHDDRSAFEWALAGALAARITTGTAAPMRAR